MTASQRSIRISQLLQETMNLLLEHVDDSHVFKNVRADARKAILALESVLTTSVGGGCVCGCPVIDGHTGKCPVVKFLRGR